MRTNHVSLTAEMSTTEQGAPTRASWLKRLCALAGCIMLASTAAGCAADEGNEGDELVDEDESALLGAKDSSAPSSVMLLRKDSEGVPRYLCSAVQVAPNVLLTAAHCVSDPDPARYGVFYGQNNTTFRAELAPVRATAADPQFNPKQPTSGHDVALVLLASKGKGKVYPINRSAITAAHFQKKAVLSGYGQQEQQREDFTAGERQQLQVRLNGFMQYQGTTYPNILAFGSPGKGICGGDSGGPALMSLGGKTRVIGVASFVFSNEERECIENSYHARTDTSLAFIDGTAAAWGVKLAR